jgi:hypothetical protein
MSTSIPGSEPERCRYAVIFRLRRLAPWLAAAGLVLLMVAGVAEARQERILSFDSQIDVLAEGDIVVEETIRVVAAGDQIRRGIYRDFPTVYQDRRGRRVRVRFDVLEVRRDNLPEAYRTQRQANGIRIYLGKEDVFLKPSTYTYTILYRCDRQIGFFEDYDELYWNVTGNGWAFSIDEARVTIRLPPGASVIQAAGYTGPMGAVGKDYRVVEADGDAGFATTRSLNPGEGFTIAVAWPKGFVTPPGTDEKIQYLFEDYQGALVGLGGLILLLAYYVAAWWKVGRDPAGGAVIPRFDPPRGISPAGMRFVRKMGFDQKALAVALVSMAVKGFLTIREAADGVFTLEQTGGSVSPLSAGEKAVARHLFPPSSQSVTLKNTAHRKIKAATKALRTSLSGEYEKVYFLRNTTYFIPGLAISLLTLLGVVLTGGAAPVGIFMVFWLSGWSAGVYFLGLNVVRAWRSRRAASAVATTLFALPFFGGEIVGIGVLASAVSLPSLVLLLAVIGVNVLFYHLFKAPTLVGRQLMDTIEGLKLYLTVAEKHRLNLLNPPERTPEHFEAMLPYAMALDVENDWNEQFADVLARATADPASGGRVHPSWYSGHTPFNQLAGSLGGAFAGAVSAASAAPGSSSGSGGGGSSGGGGGGGGGGGW